MAERILDPPSTLYSTPSTPYLGLPLFEGTRRVLDCLSSCMSKPLQCQSPKVSETGSPLAR